MTVKSVEPIKDSFVPRTVGTKEKPIAWKKSDTEVLYRASLALAALEATKGSQLKSSVSVQGSYIRVTV